MLMLSKLGQDRDLTRSVSFTPAKVLLRLTQQCVNVTLSLCLQSSQRSSNTSQTSTSTPFGERES